jgi:hypothetical protein
MTTAVGSTKSGKASSVSDLLKKARGYLSGRRALVILALTVIGVGVALNWGWLTAMGVAPILIALAPCAAMCALGLCMNKMGGKSCSNASAEADTRKAGFTTKERS